MCKCSSLGGITPLSGHSTGYLLGQLDHSLAVIVSHLHTLIIT
jgi:hypothetical protein